MDWLYCFHTLFCHVNIRSTLLLKVGQFLPDYKLSHLRRWFSPRVFICHIRLRVAMFFRCEVDEICALLGYYAACSGNPLPTFWDNLSALEDGTDGLSRDKPSILLDSWPLKMEPMGCPETNHRSSWILGPWRWNRWVVPRQIIDPIGFLAPEDGTDGLSLDKPSILLDSWP